MMRQLLLLLLLLIVNAMSMDLTPYFCKSIQQPADLYRAIKEDDYDSIYHFLDQKKILDCDKKKIQMLCNEKMQLIEKTPSSGFRWLRGAFAAACLGFYALVQYDGAYNRRHSSEVSDNTFLVVNVFSNIYGIVGSILTYNLLTNHKKKENLRNAVTINKLLYDNGYMDIDNGTSVEEIKN